MLTHPYKIEHADNSSRKAWDEYARNHADASLYHLFGWREVIHSAYGHETYGLMAICEKPVAATGNAGRPGLPAGKLAGILPLVHFNHRLFGNRLVSLPFLDGGGILADSKEAEESLLSEAVKLARKIGASRIELRHERPLSICDGVDVFNDESSQTPLKVGVTSKKARMLLALPESSEMLMKSFKSKLRSQINRPLKEGFTCSAGGQELLEDFYKVFLINMRDLGSPVHSIDLMRHVLSEFSDRTRIFMVYKSGEPVASALVVGSEKVLRNPWASSIRKYASLSPNMLLYLRMLEYGCDNGYRYFDFGRSTVGEGTYRFKEQWGAVPAPLYWYQISLDGKSADLESPESSERFRSAASLWKKLPVGITRIIGPRIRKHISL